MVLPSFKAIQKQNMFTSWHDAGRWVEGPGIYSREGISTFTHASSAQLCHYKGCVTTPYFGDMVSAVAMVTHPVFCATVCIAP